MEPKGTQQFLIIVLSTGMLMNVINIPAPNGLNSKLLITSLQTLKI